MVVLTWSSWLKHIISSLFYAGNFLWEYDHNCSRLFGQLNSQVSLLEQNIRCRPLLCNLSWCWCEGYWRSSVSYKERNPSGVLPKLWCWFYSTQRCCPSSSPAAICPSSWRKWCGEQVNNDQIHQLVIMLSLSWGCVYWFFCIMDSNCCSWDIYYSRSTPLISQQVTNLDLFSKYYKVHGVMQVCLFDSFSFRMLGHLVTGANSWVFERVLESLTVIFVMRVFLYWIQRVFHDP